MASLGALSVGQMALKSIGASSSLSGSFIPSFSTPISSLKSKKEKKTRGCNIYAGKRTYEDPFDYGEDPDIEFGSLFSEGRQSATIPRPQTDESTGLLKFPRGYNPEIASLGHYIRGDVRSCAIIVAGGVYENLLFFPVIQLMKDLYPGVEIDVIASARGKQVYELNKNVRRAWVYDVEDVLVIPADFADMLGKLKNNCYDLVMSTRPAGLGHSLFLFLTDARQKVGYVQPNANGAGASVLLSKAITPTTANLASLGYHMYKDLTDYLSTTTPFASKGLNPSPPPPVGPLKVGIPKKVQQVARTLIQGADLKPGEFVLVHGLQSTSAASMRSKGDPDCQLAGEVIARLAASTTDPVLVVVPNETDRTRVEHLLPPNARAVKITTPGQLGAVISDAKGVVASNTAALQLAIALGKPSVALFASEGTANLFVPDAREKNCIVVSSKTGKLSDVDTQSAVLALSTFATEA